MTAPDGVGPGGVLDQRDAGAQLGEVGALVFSRRLAGVLGWFAAGLVATTVFFLATAIQHVFLQRSGNVRRR